MISGLGLGTLGKVALSLQLVQNAGSQGVSGCNWSLTCNTYFETIALVAYLRCISCEAENGLGPKYLKGHHLPYQPGYALRLARKVLLVVPALSENCGFGVHGEGFPCSSSTPME